MKYQLELKQSHGPMHMISNLSVVCNINHIKAIDVIDVTRTFEQLKDRKNKMSKTISGPRDYCKDSELRIKHDLLEDFTDFLSFCLGGPAFTCIERKSVKSLLVTL